MLVNRDELEASICRDSFYDFVRAFWDVVCQEKPVWNWHIRVLCDELQEVAERLIRGDPKLHDVVINIPPGTTKSIICSQMFPAWLWTRMPSCKVISTSHAHALAMVMSRRSRDIVCSEKWKKLFGDVHLREDQNSKSNFENDAGGWRYAVGTDGTVIGRHAHFIIIDDPIDPQKAISEAELNSANRFVTETLTTRKVDKEVSVTILIMQRLHQNDPSALLLKEAKEGGTPIRHINLPGEITGNPRKVVRPRKLSSYYKNGLLDPVRLNRKALAGLRKRLGEYGYAGQILQTPVPPGGGMFKIERVQIDQPPRPQNFKRIVRYWDKAGTLGGGAYTVGLLMAEDNKGRFWILDVIRGQWDSDRREKLIFQTAQLDRNYDKRVLIGIEQEPGSGGKDSAQATVRLLRGFRVRLDRPTGDKAMRADPASVQVNAGNVTMKPADWNKELLEEMQFFPHSTYKDQVDALSGAFGLLTKPRLRIGGL